MLTLACIIYVFFCWLSNWNLLWPIEMLIKGGLIDKAISIGWGIMMVAGLNA